MKILFMGTPEPAAICLKALIDAKQDVIGAVTQPDRPKGRGLKLAPSPVKELALHNNIKVYTPEKIRDDEAIGFIKGLKPELIVVVAYGKILPKEILDIPKYGAINVHASLLPKYRGAAPVQWALMNGETRTGITIMRITEKLDAGDIMLQQDIKIEADDNTLSLTGKLFDVGSKLLVKAISQIKAGEAAFVKQDEKRVTYAPLLKKESGLIDWRKKASEINDQIRACNPWPVAYSYLNAKMLKIFSAEVGLASETYSPGEIIECVKDEGFLAAAGEGTLFVKVAQLESGKKIKAWELVVGKKIKAGDILPS